MESTISPAPQAARPAIGRLILVPAVITLAVTVLRLLGELRHWSTTWFNPAQGGGWAIVGIVWLVPVFGVYFALRLARLGFGPPNLRKAIVRSVLGAAILVAGFVIFQEFLTSVPGLLFLWSTAALAATIQRSTWQALFRALAAYAYAARVPVAIIMLIATLGRWESHYSALVIPESQAGWFSQYLLFGFFPQLIWWVGFTVTVGSLCGCVAAGFAKRGEPESTSPSS